MKFPVFVFLVLVLASVAVCVTRSNRYNEFAYTYGIFRLIEKCKTGDVHSLPIALPALNPLKIPSLTSRDSDFNLYLSQITVDGLQDMWVKRLSQNLSRYSMSIEFVVPKLTINADHYRLKTTQEILFASFNLNFFNNGFTCYISNLNVQADVQFERSGSDTVVSKLRMQYTGDVQAHFSGTPDFVNQKANDRIYQMMRDPTAIENVKDLIKQRANRYLRGRTPEDYIQIISNYAYV